MEAAVCLLDFGVFSVLRSPQTLAAFQMFSSLFSVSDVVIPLVGWDQLQRRPMRLSALQFASVLTWISLGRKKRIAVRQRKKKKMGEGLGSRYIDKAISIPSHLGGESLEIRIFCPHVSLR